MENSVFNPEPLVVWANDQLTTAEDSLDLQDPKTLLPDYIDQAMQLKDDKRKMWRRGAKR